MMQKFCKPFEGTVIAWKSNDFFRARIKLTILYVVILMFVLAFFSITLKWQLEAVLASQTQNAKLSEEDARNFARDLYPDRIIKSVELEVEGRAVIYDIDFENGLSMEIDIQSGNILERERISFANVLRADINDILLFANGFILLIGGLCSYFLAGKTLAPIRRKMQQQDRFVSDAAHELKNPLTAIQASTESLLRMKNITEEDTREVLSEVKEETDRLISQTDDLLDLDGQNNDSTLVDLAVVIARIVKKIQPIAESKNIQIQTKCDNFKLQIALSDMEKIIFNLLHNAIKFSPNDSTVKLSLTSKGLFVIEDSGIGIDEKDLPYIFDRFYKANTARTFSSDSGSGLGLSIVLKYVNESGGKINVSSKKNQGTTVSIRW